MKRKEFERMKGGWRSLILRLEADEKYMTLTIAASCVLHNLRQSRGESLVDGSEEEAGRLAEHFE